MDSLLVDSLMLSFNTGVQAVTVSDLLYFVRFGLNVGNL